MRTDRGWVSVLAMLFMIVLQATVGLAADLTSNDPRTMRFPTVEFNPPDAERVVLENGMVVYLLEDHELPLVTITATIRTGGWLDPADKVGLAALTGLVMRTGGGGAPLYSYQGEPDLGPYLQAGVRDSVRVHKALLDSLVESIPTARLLLLVNYRPEYQHCWSGKSYYHQLRIDPLPPESADELLTALLGEDPSVEPLKRLLIERTEGNPFFVEEVLPMVVKKDGRREAFEAVARQIRKKIRWEGGEVKAAVDYMLAAVGGAKAEAKAEAKPAPSR